MEVLLHLYGFSRFYQDQYDLVASGKGLANPSTCWGYLHWKSQETGDREFEFWIPARIFEEVFCNSVNKKQFTQLLVSRRFMVEPRAVQRRIPCLEGSQRFYVVDSSILGGNEPVEVAEENETRKKKKRTRKRSKVMVEA